MSRILGVSFLAFMALSSVVLFPLALVLWALTFWWDKRLALLHLLTCFWGSLYTWTMPAWPLTIEGRRHIRKGAAYVIVSNHQSLLDILMYFRLFVHFKWVSKTEIFRVPLIGWNMWLNRYIGIRRGDRQSGARMLAACSKTLRQGSSIFMFPEGTRSHDGILGHFKPGAFKLARDCGTPILPMVILGTANALPKKSLSFHGKHPIRIRVLPEIPPERIQNTPPDELALQVRSLMERELSSLSQVPSGRDETPL